MPKMKPDIKEMWVGALKSGDYQQGKDSLKSGDRFCCLGVLCDLYLKSPEGSNKKWDATDAFYDKKEGTAEIGILPRCVRDWSGLLSSNPKVEVSLSHMVENINLSILNDDFSYSFEDIAHLIMEQF